MHTETTANRDYIHVWLLSWLFFTVLQLVLWSNNVYVRMYTCIHSHCMQGDLFSNTERRSKAYQTRISNPASP